MSRARTIALAQNNDNAKNALMLNPNDFIQTDAPFELWMFLAMVTDDDGRRYVLQQRTIRLRVDESKANNSEWDFNEVFAVDYAIDHLYDNSNQSHSLAQRAALELAGTDVEQLRVWVGAYAVEVSRTTGCKQSYFLNNPNLQLQFDQHQCAPIENTKTFAYSRSVAMPVVGSYRTDEKELAVSGHGWMIHGWGVPPDASAAAVVIDRAWLLLDEQADVQLQRTRRRSGRGPTKTIASMNDIEANQAAQVPLVDSTLADNADSMQWRFIAPANEIDVTISSAIKSTHLESWQQQQWFGFVEVAGSHTGYGFINLGSL